MNVEINIGRLHLLSNYDFDCRQTKSAPLERIDSQGLSEITAARSVTVTNSNKLLNGGAELECCLPNIWKENNLHGHDRVVEKKMF